MLNFEKYLRQKEIIGILFFVFSFSIVFAQVEKMNPHLIRKYFSIDNSTLNLIVKGDVEKIQTDVEQFGGKFKYSAGNLASVLISKDLLTKWIQVPYIFQLEYLPPSLKVLDDTTAIKSNLIPVYSGTAPLSNSLTGKNVILGIIDTGLDTDHPDFLDSSGKSRILYIWDQRIPTNSSSPSPYNYGQEWNKSQIDSGLCSHQDNSYYGHGSRVAGVAVGNGNSNSTYTGVAMESDIIAVAIDFNLPGPTVPDAVSYIFSKAALLNKPAVINLSLGDYYGSHDASDLQAQLIDNLIGNGVDKAVVASAGNAGQYPFHLGYQVNADTNFTWLSNNQSNINFQVYADTNDFNSVYFSMACFQPNSYSKLGENSFKTISEVLGLIKTDTLYVNGNRLGIISSLASLSGSLYTLDISVNLDSLNYLWGFQTTGTGKFDSWNFDFMSSNLPSVNQVPRMIYYKRPDTLMTICTSFQCSEKVITVGNFLGRNTIFNLNNSTYSFGGTIDSIAPSSSLGPTRKLLLKPDLVASGENIITTIPMRFRSWFISNFPFVVTTDSFHTKFDGTSASAPIVAGMAALYFQLNPGASSFDLINQIHTCSSSDSYTGITPNPQWGFGKMNAFQTLICNFSSISERELLNDIELWPNPTDDFLFFKSNLSEEICELKIISMWGQTVYENKIYKNQNQGINLSFLEKGLYIILFKTRDSKCYTKKIVKD